MTLSPSPENVLLGKGKLLFDRFDANGNEQGLFHLGNCQTFELSTEDDVLENQNFMIAAGGVYKSVSRGRTITANITGFEFSTHSLAIGLMGEIGTYTQTTGTVTETLTTSVVKGRYYPVTTYRNITVVSLLAGTVTLTAGTDYAATDLNAGIIQVTESGAAVNGTALVIVYTRTAIAAGTAALDTISGGYASQIEGTLIFLPDPSTGPSWEIRAWRVSFNPDGAIGFISEDFGTWAVAGKFLDDSAGEHGGSTTEPYYKGIRR